MSCGGGFARDLLQGEGEILVGGFSKGVIDSSEVGVVWVGGDGVGYLRTEREIVDDLAIVICEMGVSIN